MISETENSQRMSLYNKGYTDQQIGDALYMSASSICYWRRIKGLPAHRRKNDRLTHEQQYMREVLYREGYTDAQIALRIGSSESGIESWRLRSKLPCNGKRGRKRDRS